MNSTSEQQLYHEQYQIALHRIKQKRAVVQHFFLLLLGCLFMFVINRVLNYGADYSWWIWASIGWSFGFLLHFVNVFIINEFWGKDWELNQKDKILKKIQDQHEKEEQNKKDAEDFTKHHRALEDITDHN